MADTTTTTYGLTKPEVGASADTWGTKINANFDAIDDLLDGTEIITGAKLDDTFSIVDNADNTKVVNVQLSGITTGTTRTWAFPDVSDTFVGLTATQTLTNKTLTSPTITGGLAIAQGGTGATSASAARTALGIENSAIVYLGQTTASGADEAFETDMDTYDTIMLVFESVIPATGGADLLLTHSDDDASTYETNYNAAVTYYNGTNVVAATSSSNIILAKDLGINSGGFSGIVYASVRKSPTLQSVKFYGNGFQGSPAFVYSPVQISGRHVSPFAAPTNMKVAFSTGNISSGNIKIYGIKDS